MLNLPNVRSTTATWDRAAEQARATAMITARATPTVTLPWDANKRTLFCARDHMEAPAAARLLIRPGRQSPSPYFSLVILTAPR